MQEWLITYYYYYKTRDPVTLIIYYFFTFLLHNFRIQFGAKQKPRTKRVITYQNRTKKQAVSELAAATTATATAWTVAMCVARDVLYFNAQWWGNLTIAVAVAVNSDASTKTTNNQSHHRRLSRIIFAFYRQQSIKSFFLSFFFLTELPMKLCPRS